MNPENSKNLIVSESSTKFGGIIGTNRYKYLFKCTLYLKVKKKCTSRRAKISIGNVIVNRYLSIFSTPRTVQTPENSKYLIVSEGANKFGCISAVPAGT